MRIYFMPPIVDHEQIENSAVMNGYYDNKKLFHFNFERKCV